MALLLYTGANLDPRVRQLGNEVAWAWLLLISECARRGTESITFDVALNVVGDCSLAEIIRALARAELLEMDRVELHLLARGDLWEIEE